MAGSKTAQREWWRVTRNDSEAVDIDIYGDIGESLDWWTGEKEGIGAKAFLDTLREAKGKAVNLHVNSGGGSVIDAYAMMTAISNHDGKVTAYVDGLAASAASFLVAAADEVVMSSVAWMMIHKSSVFAWGNADDLRDEVERLEKIDRQLAGIYAKRSGARTEADFADAMAETTWFTAEDAVDWGLADRIEEAVAAAACVTDDAATWRSAPDGARRSLRSGTTSDADFARATGVVRFTNLGHDYGDGEPPCDTSENIPAEADEPDAQEPPAAKDRVVRIDNRVLKIRAAREKANERKRNG